MAQRVVARLANTDRILVRPGGPGYSSHVGLSAKGAAEVRDAYDFQKVESAKDLLRTISTHRDAANDAAIALINSKQWERVWSERQILTGRAPFRDFGGKVPDAAAFSHEHGVLWIEIENSRRGGRDMKKLAAWLQHWAFPPAASVSAFLDPPQDQFWLGRVRFIMTNPKAETFPERLRYAMSEFGWSLSAGLNQIEFLDISTGELSVW